MKHKTVIQAERLRKVYGSIIAVDEVSFEVREGEIFLLNLIGTIKGS